MLRVRLQIQGHRVHTQEARLVLLDAPTPYVRPDGVRIADDWNDLILNGPHEGITVTELGQTMLLKAVWTGTGPNGELSPDTLTCQSWKTEQPTDKGRFGISGVDEV